MRRLAAAVAAVFLAASPAAGNDFQADPWLADLDQLRDALSAGYANLDWQAERGLDLKAIYERTRRRLAAASDDYAARRAMERFIAAFADGHLEISWPTVARPGPAPQAAAPLCARLGFFDAGDGGAVATRLPGFRPVGPPDATLAAGLVTVGDRKVGVLRVPIFTAQGFPGLCEQRIARRQLSAGSPCDQACSERLKDFAKHAFIAELRGQLAAIAAERPDVVLVDIAGNGGGDLSAFALAKMLSAKPLSRPRMGMMRGSALDRELAGRQVLVAAAMGAGPLAQRTALRRFHDAITRARAEAVQPCNRAPLWEGRQAGCSGLVDEPRYDGPLPAEDADLASRPAWVEVASPTAGLSVGPPLWRGPLVVLVDGDSASSSELFAAVLQDAGGTVILGARSAGAGCGHTTGAEAVTLANSRAVVRMPDCARLRADGSSEVAGVQPDAPVDFRPYDTARRRLELVSAALPAALELAIRRTPR